MNGEATESDLADGTYTFTVTGPGEDGTAQQVTVTIEHGESDEVQVDGLVPGTYTVSEDEGSNPAGMMLMTDNDQEVNVTANNTEDIPTAEFTNNLGLGSLKIKKNVTVNGEATESDLADGTYTFTVTGPGDYSSTQTITITNGVSDEVQVDDLVPGTYTVSEEDPEKAGITLVTDNDLAVKVTANNTADIQTAEFTNNYSNPVKGEIKVKKVLKGRPWRDRDVFTFKITAPAGTPMPDETRITITRDDLDQIKSFGEIVFTKAGKYVYTVEEIRGNIWSIRYDTSEHKVTIEVIEDDKGNLIAKNGTQLIQTVTITNTYSRTPKTGDNSNPRIYAGMMAASSLGLLSLIVSRRKRKSKS